MNYENDVDEDITMNVKATLNQLEVARSRIAQRRTASLSPFVQVPRPLTSQSNCESETRTSRIPPRNPSSSHKLSDSWLREDTSDAFRICTLDGLLSESSSDDDATSTNAITQCRNTAGIVTNEFIDDDDDKCTQVQGISGIRAAENEANVYSEQPLVPKKTDIGDWGDSLPDDDNEFTLDAGVLAVFDAAMGNASGSDTIKRSKVGPDSDSTAKPRTRTAYEKDNQGCASGASQPQRLKRVKTLASSSASAVASASPTSSKGSDCPTAQQLSDLSELSLLDPAVSLGTSFSMSVTTATLTHIDTHEPSGLQDTTARQTTCLTTMRVSNPQVQQEQQQAASELPFEECRAAKHRQDLDDSVTTTTVSSKLDVRDDTVKRRGLAQFLRSSNDSTSGSTQRVSSLMTGAVRPRSVTTTISVRSQPMDSKRSGNNGAAVSAASTTSQTISHTKNSQQQLQQSQTQTATISVRHKASDARLTTEPQDKPRTVKKANHNAKRVTSTTCETPATPNASFHCNGLDIAAFTLQAADEPCAQPTTVPLQLEDFENTHTVAYPQWTGLPSKICSAEGDGLLTEVAPKTGFPKDVTQQWTQGRAHTEMFVGRNAMLTGTLAKNKLNEGLNQCLGTCIVDLGYKLLYLSSAKQICKHLPVWSHHRPKTESKVLAIADQLDCKSEDDAASLDTPRFPGVVSVYVLQDGIRFDAGIFDGQHRLAAAQVLLERRRQRVISRVRQAVGHTSGQITLSPEDEEEIDFELLVEVWPVQTLSELTRLYLMVNKVEPVGPGEAKLPDVVLEQVNPTSAGVPPSVTAPSSSQIIAEATAQLYQRYRPMFRSTSRCLPPYLNLEVLRAKLTASHICTKLQIHTAEKLVQVLEEINTQLSKKCTTYWPLKLRSGPELKKAQEARFFLGLDEFKWLDEFIHHYSAKKAHVPVKRTSNTSTFTFRTSKSK